MKTRMVVLAAIASLMCGSMGYAGSPNLVLTGCDGNQACNQGICDQCGGDDCRCCVSPCYMPVWRVFGEGLYLNARDADVAWAVVADGPAGPGVTPVQVGPVAVIDPDYDPGFRIGFARALDNTTALEFRYTWFENDAHDFIDTVAGDVIQSMTSHPSNVAAASTGLFAEAWNKINFQTLDIDFRNTFYSSNRSSLTYLVGARYAHLEQDFAADYFSLGTDSVDTEINFDGGGIRFGIEGERYSRNTGIFGYAKAHASFVAGQFQADYTEVFPPGQPAVANTTWEADRIVTIVDLEAGLGWTSCNGRLRLSGGYLVSFWANAVTTDEFIAGVQENDFVDLGDGIAFDGIVGRAELRY